LYSRPAQIWEQSQVARGIAHNPPKGEEIERLLGR
jgi:hypothetical protein